MGEDHKEGHVGRRDFIKTTTMAGMAAGFPAAGAVAQQSAGASKSAAGKTKRNLLFLSDSTKTYEALINSIRSIREYDFSVAPVQINYQQLQEVEQHIRAHNPDVVFMCLPRVTTSAGTIAAHLEILDVPVIFLPPSLDLIMLEADLAARLRMKGVNALLANSQSHALDLIRIAAAPRILEGKKAVIFGNRFDSSSVPDHHLSEEYIYKHTGVRLQYRAIEELKPLLEKVDEAAARKEMERWKREAVKVVEAKDQEILNASKLYVLLRSLVDKEGLSAISIDCLRFSFNANPTLPYPCLSFTRLRDEGVAAPCEADVCASLSSMLLQEISHRPSYFCNVSSVDSQKSTVVLRHCVAPLKLMGLDAPAQPYNLRDYHGMGRGVVPEVQFPLGVDITFGGFTKDLKQFVVWPGRTQAGANDTERPSFENPPKGMEKMRKFCSNRAEVKIKDVDRFLQKITGIHHVMVTGSYTKALHDAMVRMNVDIVGPADMFAPQA